MRFRLIPADKSFFDLFEQSTQIAVEGAKLYREMVERYEDPRASCHAIVELEHRGDEITHDIIRRLNTSFVTPIDREDIHALAANIDDVVDFIEAAADTYILHKIEAPTEEARRQADILVRACESVAEGVKHLRRFKGLDKYWIAVNSIENEGDRLYREAIARLFGGDYKAMDVLKWKEIYDVVEHAIDHCENVANLMEAIVLKHA